MKTFRRVVSVFLVCVFLIGQPTYLPKKAEAAENIFCRRTIIPAFEEKDVSNHFENYSDNIYYYRNSGKENTKIIGAVYDDDKGLYLGAATIIFVELGYSVKSDSHGRFCIYNIPDGNYTIKVKSDGYCEAYYELPVRSIFGFDIYSLAISKGYSIRESAFEGAEYELKLEHENDEKTGDVIGDAEYSELLPHVRTVPTLPSFTVKYGTSTLTFGSNMNYGYLFYVVANELLHPDDDLYSGINSTYLLEAFKAQAVASRSYATGKAAEGSHCSNNPLCTLCSESHCQVYNPSYTNGMAITAVISTQNEIMYSNSIGAICVTFYFSTCLGYTESKQSAWGGAPVHYLTSVYCPYDLRPSMQTVTHPVGMCQDGAVGCAAHGYTYEDILTHYYTGAVLVTANPCLD